MRFICDLCPSTAAEGHTVVIGHYETWLRHLLTPQHQTEHSLAMRRTSYWPEAEWVAIIHDLPPYEKSTAEIYVEILTNLSEYGFVEAVAYGGKVKDSMFVAIQCYETKPVPAYLKAGDGTLYKVRVTPKAPVESTSGSNACKSRKRSFRYISSSSTLSEESETPSPTCRNVATSPIPSRSLFSDRDSLVKGLESVIINSTEEVKKTRIKYDRNTLLLFRGEKSMPARFSEVLQFPRYLIVDPEAKLIDPLKMKQSPRKVMGQVADGENGSNYRNGFTSNGVKVNGNVFGGGQQNRTGWTQQANVSGRMDFNQNQRNG